MNPIELVLRRLPDARKTSRGWQACCPAHDDRTPSLSISEGSDGRVLLNCFPGCEFAEIVSALGLRPHELFPPSDDYEMRRRSEQIAAARREYRKAPMASVRAYLEREVPRSRAQRLERDPDDTPHYRSADVNAARKRANALFETEMQPIQRYAWEGFAPHDRDPMWPGLFEVASERVAAEMPDAQPPARVIAASDRAARWLHELARTTNYKRVTAA